MRASNSALENDIALNASDYLKLGELMKQKEKLDTELNYLMERWVYLNDLAERIEKEKG